MVEQLAKKGGQPNQKPFAGSGTDVMVSFLHLARFGALNTTELLNHMIGILSSNPYKAIETLQISVHILDIVWEQRSTTRFLPS